MLSIIASCLRLDKSKSSLGMYLLQLRSISEFSVYSYESAFVLITSNVINKNVIIAPAAVRETSFILSPVCY